MPAVPTTTVNLSTENFLNANFDFSVTFDNTSATNTDTGYGPFFDLTVPEAIDFNPASASLLGEPITAITLIATWDATQGRWENGSGNPVTAHPLNGGSTILALPTGTVDGDAWYQVVLPFGSYAATQPAITVDFQGNQLDSGLGATVGAGLSITARGGFQYGTDAIDNPSTDPPIQQAAAATSTITPVALSLAKISNAAELESVSGENFPITYTVTVNVAQGETINNLVLRDVLPDNLAYVNGSFRVVQGTNPTTTELPTAGSAQNSPNNDFQLTFSSITGGANHVGVVIEYQAFIPQLNAGGSDAINPAQGDNDGLFALNESRVTGTYQGTPVSDGLINGLFDAPSSPTDQPTDARLEVDAIAIQKGVSVVGGGGVVPNANLEYTLDFQISDYFNFNNIVITDVLSDGQRLDSTPTLVITGNNGTTITVPVNFTPGTNFTETISSPGTGNSTLVFNVSALLNSAIGSGILKGNEGFGSGTTGKIVYQTNILEEFTDTFPSGDPSVDVGDILTSQVSITGDIVDDLGNATGFSEAEDSNTQVEVDPLNPVDISVYAIDGVTLNPGDPARISPGGTITYRLRTQLSSLDIENLKITDYLPLPVTNVTEVTVGAIAGTGTPAAGDVNFGPDYNLGLYTFTKESRKNKLCDQKSRNVTR